MQLSSPATIVATLTILSLFLHTFLDMIKDTLKAQFPNLTLWWFIFVAVLAGIVLAFAAQLNALAELLPNLSPVAGYILTGIAIGGGSRFIELLFGAVETYKKK